VTVPTDDPAKLTAPEAGGGVPSDFSLVLGGPLYQLLLRTRMARPPLDLLHRRMIAIPLVAWVPLLVLSMVEGRAVGGGVAVQFLHDVEAHVRYLIAVPLLVLAEMVVHARIRPLVGQFLTRGLIPGEARPRFDAIVASVMRLRNSVALEVFFVAFVYTVGHYLWRQEHAPMASTWFASTTDSGLRLTWAGFWYAWVSIPIFQFLLLRWYFRLFLWIRFLWQVSRLELRLLPTHPDRAGGLGFLGGSPVAFAPVLVAQSALLSGTIAGRIFFEGAALPDFKREIAGAVVILALLVLAPLFLFMGHLVNARRRGINEYGPLASRYVIEFDRKWVRGGAPADEPLVGSADIQSLADLANSFEVIRGMRPFPFGKEAVIQLVVTVALPFLPLLLTMFPLEELLTNFVKVLL
jgi:hypothetical protein